MNIRRERPPFSTISGTMVPLGERDTVAIYRWGGLSWVAQFRDGRGELSDAATWFRVNAAWLRARCVGSVSALETVTPLTPEMIERIGELHRQIEAKGPGRLVSAAAAGFAAVGRAWGRILPRLQGSGASRIHRVG